MISQINDLNVTLGSHAVLKNLNWSLPQGKVIGLLGKNGAGKSTLIRTMLGLVLPKTGSINTFGQVPREMGDNEKKRLAYVPQSAIGYEGMRVSHAISVHASCYENWDRDLQQRMIERFQLPTDTRVQKLSVGQRQSLMLIFALCCRPELLIMDEPVASLDPSARREVLQFVAEYADEQSTILYSTHITADLNRMADEVALLADGNIQFHKNISEIEQSVLIKGFLPQEFINQEANEGNILIQSSNEVILSNWDDAKNQKLNSDTLIQKLNLEELFIRWHNILDSKKGKKEAA